VDELRQTSAEGIFACGNAVQVHDLVDYVTEESRIAGRSAAMYVLGKGAKGETLKVTPGERVRYVVPQTIRRGDGAKLFFRVTNVWKGVTIEIKLGDKTIYSARKLKVAPGEMETVELAPEKLASGGGELTVSVTGGE
jgi:hypothetical protein